MKKKLCALLMLGLLILPLVFTNSIVAESPKSKEDTTWEKRRAFIEENMIAIGSQGPEKVDEWLAANGIQKAEGVQVVEPMSAPGSAKVYNIDGYFDTLSKKYIIKGWWSWLGESLPDYNPGALDAVSLAMCKTTNWSPVTGYILASSPAGIAVYDQYGNYYPYAGGVSKIDKSGVVYTFQDSWEDNGYCGYKGQVWLWMSQKPTQLPIYVKMDFMHTWTSASLIDIPIRHRTISGSVFAALGAVYRAAIVRVPVAMSTSSFGFTWPTNSAPTINLTFNSTPQNWEIANQITLRDWPYRLKELGGNYNEKNLFPTYHITNTNWLIGMRGKY